MGASLEKPITKKVSTDEVGEFVICGASSMQGWRVTQEDAHNCILDYDTATSYFAVYDGHGGHEVAMYSAQHLPEYLKNCEAYKKGDYSQALKDAFLEFDATLTTPEVVDMLKKIADKKDEEDSGSDEDENVKNLYEEAQMPLEQVIAKYQNGLVKKNKKIKKEDCEQSASSSGAGSSSAGSSKSRSSQIQEWTNGNVESDEDSDKNIDTGVSSSSSQAESSSSASKNHTSNKANQASTKINGDSKPNGEVETANSKETMPDCSGDTKLKNNDKTEEISGENINVAGDSKKELNGEMADEKSETPLESKGVSSSSVAQQNGEAVTRRGKERTSSRITPHRRSIQKIQRDISNIYRNLLANKNVSDSDQDDSDESFEGAESNSDDDDDDDDEDGEEDSDSDSDSGASDSDEDVCSDSELDESEDKEKDDTSMLDDEEDDESDEFLMKMIEKPGSNSGSTAVVALLKGKELYVANAGDSRCIVCRKGQAVEMSLDHKPEDEPERARIVKAGGKVTREGRVNGGLNLSRALGDHAYKQKEELNAEEQMITALPDVKTLTIDPAEDEFMILACDGIWNSMSSQEVVDFIRTRILNGETKLSKICEELFDHCLAPHSFAEGNDNMTAVIVQFRPELTNKNDNSLKRAASPICESDSEVSKRPKTEESLAANV